jgi:apolipoprotein N-acyltransferase
MDIFFGPVVAIHGRPVLAFLPALAFALLALAMRGRARRPAIVLALVSAAWTVFGIYETAMREWEKTVSAPIRVDLVLLTPVLWLMTMIGIGAATMSILRARRA